MRKWIILLIVLGTGVSTLAQDAAVHTPSAYITSLNNYIRSWEAVAPDTNAGNFLVAPALGHSWLTTQYFDGLGRPIETVAREGSYPTGGAAVDLVSPQVYDEYGREQRKYLPFPASTYGGNSSVSDGGFKSNPFQEQSNFYSSSGSPIDGQGETYYYGKTEFEPSPLDRVVGSYGAGDNWVHQGHGATTGYWVNTVADSVRVWRVANSGAVGVFATYKGDSLYGIGQLYKTIITDENGGQSIEFKDREGNVVLKKVQFSASADNGSGSGYTGWLCTYYVYDSVNLLRAVIQPVGVQLLQANSWNINALSGAILGEQCFRYEYDGKRRMSMKKIPAAGPVCMVYDQRDRLVLSQDSLQRAGGKWLYTLYDSINRPVATGLWTNSNTLSYHAGQAYNSSAYPNLSGQTYEELTRSFYDGYGWLSSYSNPLSSSRSSTYDGNFSYVGTWPFPQNPTLQSTLLKGLATGKRVEIPGTGTYLYSINFYDDWHRVIQVQNTNVTGGTDVLSTEYCFNGKVLRTIDVNQKSGTNAQTNALLTKYIYDSLYRVVQTCKMQSNSLVNGGALPSAWTITAQSQYDALGRQSQKNVGNKPGYAAGTPLANQSYVYNIRGWLLSINKAYESAGTGSDIYFGMELGYDKTYDGPSAYEAPQYNGNIMGTAWRSAGSRIERRYNYRYDAANRITRAEYLQNTTGSTWDATQLDFSMWGWQSDNGYGLKYDANGNLQMMILAGWKGGSSSQIINGMAYTYYNSNASNRLQQVDDGYNDSTTTLGNFHFNPATKTSTDYTYDGNGNLTKDNNKRIDTILYNYLNLPSQVHFKGKGTVSFTYDATGVKWKKTVVDSTLSPVRTITTVYLGGVIFQNDTLQLVQHEEGRIRLDTTGGLSFVYDYFLRDHLGNTRSVVTEESETDAYPVASLEDASLANESLYYGSLDTGRVNKSTVGGYPNDTYTSPNNYIQQLSGASGAHTVGANIVLKVMAGDTVNIRSTSWYRQAGASPGSPSSPLSSLVLGLSGGVIVADPGHFALSTLQSPGVLNPGISSFLTAVGGGYNTLKPKAFLNWVLFDEQFNYVAGSANTNSGFRQVGNDTTLTNTVVTGQIMTVSGYLFVYVSNETPNINVFFDNLQVTHLRGRLLEETHYYPYGLAIAGISSQAAGKPDNRFKFNKGSEIQHKEINDGSGLDWYSTYYRMYDMQLGRWNQIDPSPVVSESPFAGMANNPVFHNDPLGDTIKVNGGFWESIIVTAAFSKLNKSPTAQKGIQSLISSKNTFTINLVGGDQSSQFTPDNPEKAYKNEWIASGKKDANDQSLQGGSGGTINWNPNKGAELTAEGDIPDYTSRPEINLAHELLGHALDADQGLQNDGEGKAFKMQDRTLPINEYQASHQENKIRSELGLPLRTYYGGKAKDPNTGHVFYNGNGVLLTDGTISTYYKNYDYSVQIRHRVTSIKLGYKLLGLFVILIASRATAQVSISAKLDAILNDQVKTLKKTPRNLRAGYESLMIDMSLFKQKLKEAKIIDSLYSLNPQASINIVESYNDAWGGLSGLIWFGDEQYIFFENKQMHIHIQNFTKLSPDKREVVKSFANWNNPIFSRKKYDASLRNRGNDGNSYYLASKYDPKTRQKIKSVAFYY